MVTPDTPIPEWLAGEHPFGLNVHRTSAGARMAYVDEGPRSSEAVLMVHGNPTWSFYYRNVIRELSPQIRCIAPDHVGMGRSDKPQDYPYTLDRRIADLSELVDALGLTRVHLLVHDWGGAIGLGWAGRNPDRVGRICILNTGAFRSSRIPFRISLCRAPVLGTLLVRGLNGFAGPATWMAMGRRKLNDVERRAYLWPHGDWHDRVAVDGFVKDIPLNERHPSYATLVGVENGLAALTDKPVFMVWGGRDFCFNDTFLAEFRRRFPAANALRLDAGHYVLEDGRPQSLGLVTEFLAPDAG